MLTENDIVELIASYLINDNCEIVSKCTTIQTGIDIVARRENGQMIYVEAKGETSSIETSKRFGKPFNGSQITNHLGEVILSTLKNMSSTDRSNSEYIIAIPATKKHKEGIKKIKPVIDMLNIKVKAVNLAGIEDL